MPGVSQIIMLTILIERHSGWLQSVKGGSVVKFLRPVVPGEVLELQLQRSEENKVNFSVGSRDGGKSKGTLHLSGGLF